MTARDSRTLVHFRFIASLVLCVGNALAGPSTAGAADVAAPSWAYPVSPAPASADQAPDAQGLQSLPGTAVRYTRMQLRDLFSAPDWRPETHPAMPDIVATGRRPAVFACAYCHQPTGVGRPENANLTGLSAAYMRRQVADYRSGLRKCTVPAMLPQLLMARETEHATQDELDAAIDYFASLPARSMVKVVEADTVPRTRPGSWMLTAIPDGSREALGARIVELADDAARVDLRDAAASFTAYVPRGSVQAGRKLAQAGTAAPGCESCHGPQLRGQGDAPPIAGRSPTFLVRQLVDFKSGARAGQMSAQMRDLVSAMSPSDLIDAAAYAASLAP